MFLPARRTPLQLVLSLAVLCCVVGCETTAQQGELSSEQCAKLVRKERQIRSQGSNAMQLAGKAAERSTLQNCKVRGTERAYRCVMRAESLRDLRSCEPHYR